MSARTRMYAVEVMANEAIEAVFASKDFVESVSELKRALLLGCELWHVASRRDRLPGRWELRFERSHRKVSWDAIIKARRNLEWWRKNTEEIEDGPDWLYRVPREVRGQLEIALK